MNWYEENNTLIKEFEFSNFTEAVVFVNKVAKLANEMNHHPDLLIHSYKKVRVSLTTHSEGRVTERDHELAQKIDALA